MNVPSVHTATMDSVGESGVLAAILRHLPPAAATVLGPGDDAAVVAQPDGRTVVTTDLMVNGPDFRLAWSTGFDLGWKAAASNLADVAAMGATPTALVVALAVPGETTVSFMEDVARGLAAGCAALAPGCGVVGGDLSVSGTLTIAVTAFGDLGGRPPVLRSGARPGDRVALAGRAGMAARGLALLFAEGVDEAGVPDGERARELRSRERDLVEAQLRPEPPISAGPEAARAGATAMMDVSDGLVLDATRLASASGCAINLSTQALAVFGPQLEMIITGGEDHALLATFPEGAAIPEGFREIGRVGSGAGVSVDGVPVTSRGGWDPYSDWDGAAG
ncbi:MAG: thiamine-phosphate kinase [Mycetocola sp.]